MRAVARLLAIEGLIVALAAVVPGLARGQAAPAPAARRSGLAARRYHAGDSLHYQMDATNQGPGYLQHYSARADGVVRRDSLGRFVEDYTWSHLMRDNSPMTLPDGPGIRQRVTLSPEFMLPPDVAHTTPALIAPTLDFYTFYVDLWLAGKLPLTHAGAHGRIPGHGPNSWADGTRITVGQDAVDFDITLTDVDSVAGVAHVLVRHVPPANAQVPFPAEWMKAPLYDTPNNWVQIEHTDSSYDAGVGRETFDVQLGVALRDGRIVSATMENPVDVMARTCRDAALTQCGEPRRYQILRKIALRQAGATRN